jgi:hypothetical protein
MDILSVVLNISARNIPTADLIKTVDCVLKLPNASTVYTDEIDRMFMELRKPSRISEVKTMINPTMPLCLINCIGVSGRCEVDLLQAAFDKLLESVPHLSGYEVGSALQVLVKTRTSHTAFVDSVITFLPIIGMEDDCLIDVYTSLSRLVDDAARIGFIRDFIRFRLVTVE